jgi:enoyl-CoA hydratase/carnithine racemase
MPAPDTVLKTADRDRVRLLTLNRPDALNAFNDAMYVAIADALQEAAGRDDIAVAVLTGAGRAFSAGQDLHELSDGRSHAERVAAGFGAFIETIEAFPKPLIAAVNGIGVGIGLTLLPHCDLVLIAEDARLRAPFASLGVAPEAGSSWLLPDRVGHAAAAHILFTGAWIDAARAVEIGLAWRAVPSARLLDEALVLAGEIAAMPVPALVAAKKLLLDGRLEAVRAARRREDVAFASLLDGPANKEAIAAFATRRVPGKGD